jgi:hypothetical protein
MTLTATTYSIMRSRRHKGKRRANPSRSAATETAKKDFEAQIQDFAEDFNDVQPEKVLDAQHPFELAGLCGDKPLSVVQKAITYCIQYLGGEASENQILAFFHRYWSQIIPETDQTDQTDHPVPDKRVLRINFKVQKENRFLFVRSLHDQQKWCLNTSRAPIEPNRRTTDQIVPFQDRLVVLLRNHDQGLSLEELFELTKEFASAEGMYQNLPHDRRLITCLTVKKAVQEVHFQEKQQRWRAGPARSERRKSRSEGSVSSLLKGVHVSDLTVNELWNLLKEKGIY